MTSSERTIAGRYRTIYTYDESTPVAVTCCRDDQTGDLVFVAEWILPDDATRALLSERATQLQTLSHEALCPLLTTHNEPGAWIAVARAASGHAFGAALRMRNATFPETDVVTQTIRLLGILEQAQRTTPQLHLAGMVDADIIVQDDGSWVLLPFALLRSESTRSTPYRAPELITESRNTTATDIYAVTALAYHATTGSLPPSAENHAEGVRLVNPKARAAHLSDMWDAVLVRGLQPKPVNRYQHAHEMIAALAMLAVLGDTTPEVVSALPRATEEPEAGQGRMLAGNVPATTTSTVASTGGQSPFRLGCLVAVAATLVIIGIMLCVLLLLVTPWSPLRSLYNGNFSLSFNSAATTPTAVPGVSKAIVAATPTPIPFTASSQTPIGQANVAQLTSTGVITNTTFGPVAWSPDGSKLAVAVGNTISLHESEQLSELRRLTGHVGDITTLSWSPDGRFLASGASDDSVIHVYDTNTGTEAYTLRGHEGWIRTVAFSPDGSMLATGSTDLSIRIWSVATRRTEHTLTGHTDLIGGIAWAPDGTGIATAARDGTVRRWDLRTDTQDPAFAYSTALNAQAGAGVRFWATGLVWSHDGKTLAVGATDGTVTILDAQTGAVQRTLKGHTSWITIRGLALTTDDSTLYSAGLDGLLTVWDYRSGTQKAQYNQHKMGIFGITLEPNEQRLVSTSDQEGKLLVWNLADESISALRVGTGLPLEILYAPKAAGNTSTNEVLAICGINGLVKLHTTAGAANNYIAGTLTGTQSLAFYGTDRFAMIDSQNQVDRYTPQSSTPEPLPGVIGTPLAVASSPDGTVLVVAGVDGAQLWRTDSFANPTTLNTSLREITHIAFSPDGSKLALRAGGTKPGYDIWDLNARKLMFHSDTDVYRIAFLAGNDQIALLTKTNAIEIRPVLRGTPTQRIEPADGNRFVTITTIPNSTLIVAADVNGAVFVYASDGNVLATLPQEDSVTALAVNPASTELAVGHRDGSITRYAIP